MKDCAGRGIELQAEAACMQRSGMIPTSSLIRNHELGLKFNNADKPFYYFPAKIYP